MNFKFVFITAPFVALFFLSLVIEFFFMGPIYCWMTCLLPQISCLATVSYTFGLVPATALAASSALAGCLTSFDMCELSCAKSSELRPFSLGVNISNTCEIYRNGTKIKAIDIKYKSYMANPYNLDSDCHAMPYTTTFRPPSTTTALPSTNTALPATTPFSKLFPPRVVPEMESDKDGAPREGNVSRIIKHPTVHGRTEE